MQEDEAMKYYKELLKIQCFTRADVERLTGNSGAANSVLSGYQKKGYISLIKRNLYAAVSMETGQTVANRYFIGSHITDGANLSHHAAFLSIMVVRIRCTMKSMFPARNALRNLSMMA
jgi:predicted transcriptional regulator of viral defense system